MAERLGVELWPVLYPRFPDIRLDRATVLEFQPVSGSGNAVVPSC